LFDCGSTRRTSRVKKALFEGYVRLVARQAADEVAVGLEAEHVEAERKLHRAGQPGVGLHGNVHLVDAQGIEHFQARRPGEQQVGGVDAPALLLDVDESPERRVGAPLGRDLDLVHLEAVFGAGADEFVVVHQQGTLGDGRHEAPFVEVGLDEVFVEVPLVNAGGRVEAETVVAAAHL